MSKNKTSAPAKAAEGKPRMTLTTSEGGVTIVDANGKVTRLSPDATPSEEKSDAEE